MSVTKPTVLPSTTTTSSDRNPPSTKTVPDTFFDRRVFLEGVAGLATIALAAKSALPAYDRLLGPIVGHTDESSAVVWMRAVQAGDYQLEISAVDGGKTQSVTQAAVSENDLCLHWHVKGLEPATKYRYRVMHQGKAVAEHTEQVITTATAVDTKARVRLAISSCAKEDQSSREVWNRMKSEQVDGVVLIGDTPYIDSTELTVQTQRHREFASVEEYQALLRSTPCWWTWDDHDFAGNDASGLAVGKENSRLVYTRYRPQSSFGNGKEGIYTSFRRGPVEIFLLDTRWFAMTEPSFASAHKPTLLGKAQWEWLQKGLLASTAPFKLLACGVIWDDKENTESDDWGTYKHELTAIQKFIGDHRIPGVVLVGGDIHASRVLRYKTSKTVGYDLVQFIASPIHSSTIPSLNVYHPDLVRSAVEPNVFLLVDADSTKSPPEFQATLINRHGEHVFTYRL